VNLNPEEVTALLKNVGVDTECGACLEVAFTGGNSVAHTCKKLGTFSTDLANEILNRAMNVIHDVGYTNKTFYDPKEGYSVIGALGEALGMNASDGEMDDMNMLPPVANFFIDIKVMELLDIARISLVSIPKYEVANCHSADDAFLFLVQLRRANTTRHERAIQNNSLA
jgi:hypothetical protein